MFGRITGLNADGTYNVQTFDNWETEYNVPKRFIKTEHEVIFDGYFAKWF